MQDGARLAHASTLAQVKWDGGHGCWKLDIGEK
jgi:hypothetical protein